MSAKSLLLWTAAGVIAVFAAAQMTPAEAPVTTFDASLGPAVTTEPL